MRAAITRWRCVATVALVPALVACGTRPSAESLELAPLTDSTSVGAASARAAKAGLRDVTVFPEQSFRLSLGVQPLGSLVTGRGVATGSDGRANSTCFLVIVWSDHTTDFLPTVGSGDWEAVACIAVDAVGVVARAGGMSADRLAVIHRAASPNAATIEPVVLRWNPLTQHIAIDTASSAVASLAGATTIESVRRVLMNAR
jgi:hypothetical protein